MTATTMRTVIRKRTYMGVIVFLLFIYHNRLPQFSDYSTPIEVEELVLAEISEEQQTFRTGTLQKEPVHLVYASDHENLPAVEASIRSAMQHASEPVVFHFVGDTPLSSSFSNVRYYNLTEVAAKYRLEEFTNIRKRKEESLAGLNSNLANFVRFVISDLLPNQHKAMWVDADTVIECDVVSMVRNALTKTSHAIAAVPIDRKPMGIASKVLKSRSRELSTSFNAGVFVVDLDRWRSRELTKQVRKLTLKNRKEQIYAYGSQPPLVLTIGDKFEHMSPAWNVKVNKLNRGHFNGNACLWHWSGKRKPWNTSNDPDIHNELWQRYATGNTDKMQEFQPTNLVLAERVPCGACKCFYQLKSDSQAGYLVAPSSTPRILKNMGSEENWFDALEKGWYYAEHLRRKYKITHLLLSPPTNMTVSKELATYLNSNLWNVGHDEEYDGRYDEGNMECYKEGSTVSLQRVAKAPQPNLLLGIQYHKYEAFKYELNQFLATIKNKESFARRFSQGIADTRKLLRKEPCLVSDFQLLLDKKGNIYHLDFERCFRSDARDEAELCFKALDEAEQLVYQAVSQQP